MPIKRDAFLYLEPERPQSDFAQCGACTFFRLDGKCVLLDMKVSKEWSCGFFVDGLYSGLPSKPFVTAEEAGLFKGHVRCENCKYGGETCKLYDMLNAAKPADFDLDPKIKPYGCCNAFQPSD